MGKRSRRRRYSARVGVIVADMVSVLRAHALTVWHERLHSVSAAFSWRYRRAVLRKSCCQQNFAICAAGRETAAGRGLTAPWRRKGQGSDQPSFKHSSAWTGTRFLPRRACRHQLQDRRKRWCITGSEPNGTVKPQSNSCCGSAAGA